MTSDDAAIVAALDALDEALDRRDARAVTALFTDDRAVTFWGSAESEEAIGPDAIRHLLGSLLEEAGSPGTFTLTLDDRRITIRGEVAWVNASGNATWERPGRATVKMPYRLTAILVKEDGVWRLHTHHGSSPDEG